MKTILVTAYAVNPYKGSEDGMGWNFACQIARFNKIILLTRKNNQAHIDQFLSENQVAVKNNMHFLYYDTPYWMRFWKKGGRGALIYYYMWQFGIVRYIKSLRLSFDVVHNLNFHNDWTPSFLWRLNKPFVWGPVGHHPLIPIKFLLPVFGIKAYLKDRFTWMVKLWFWKLDPLLFITKEKAALILAMNSEAVKKLNIPEDKFEIMPSVGTDDMSSFTKTTKSGFKILSVGRFTSLKGFDITIRAFSLFLKRLSEEQRREVSLTLIGSGESLSFFKTMINELDIQENVKIIEWIERNKLKEQYEQSHVFFFPSHEGAGMVIAEALSCSLPVVCLDNCGPGEFIDETCGRRVKYGAYKDTLQAFSETLFDIFNQPEMYQKLSKGARARYESHFAWDRKGEALKMFYERF
jgi:glycosyltransferase involved in cell wall biosynthesis